MPNPQHDRYDTTGNPETEYVDAERTVLKNNLGISDRETLERAEEEFLMEAYQRLLGEIRQATPMTCDLIRYIHESIFGRLYSWAGKWRTVWISNSGMTWPAPDFIDQHMREFEQTLLSKLRASSLTDDEAFCDAVARIQGEFLVIHPFREGNARTIKLVSDLLAVQSGRAPLIYDLSESGRAAYIAGAQSAFQRDYERLLAVIRQALRASNPTS